MNSVSPREKKRHHRFRLYHKLGLAWVWWSIDCLADWISDSRKQSTLIPSKRCIIVLFFYFFFFQHKTSFSNILVHQSFIIWYEWVMSVPFRMQTRWLGFPSLSHSFSLSTGLANQHHWSHRQNGILVLKDLLSHQFFFTLASPFSEKCSLCPQLIP